MLERLHEKHRLDESGFTLIELLIVIIILGILAAIVVFSVTGLQNNAGSSACSTTVKTIDTAAEAYYAQYSAPAAGLGALVGTGFLHADSNFTAGMANTTPTLQGGYTITFTPGAVGPPASAGDAKGSLASC